MGQRSFAGYLVVLAYALSCGSPSMPGMLVPWGQLWRVDRRRDESGKAGISVVGKVVQRNTRLGWVLLAAAIH